MAIALQLGYPITTLDPFLDLARATRASDLVAQLDAIDSALASARLDSMASEVGELKVDYQRHISLLKSEGSRLLKELANLCGMIVAYDRFQGETATLRSSPYSIQSYW